MRVKYIEIGFEPSITRKDIASESDTGLATKMRFENGAWLADGPILSRYCGMAHEIWQLVRNVAKAAGE